MKLAAFLAAAVVLAQAGAAVALLVVGSYVAGVLLAVGALATVLCLSRILRSVRRPVPSQGSFTATEQHFY